MASAACFYNSSECRKTFVTEVFFYAAGQKNTAFVLQTNAVIVSEYRKPSPAPAIGLAKICKFKA